MKYLLEENVIIAFAGALSQVLIVTAVIAHNKSITDCVINISYYQPIHKKSCKVLFDCKIPAFTYSEDSDLIYEREEIKEIQEKVSIINEMDVCEPISTEPSCIWLDVSNNNLKEFDIPHFMLGDINSLNMSYNEITRISKTAKPHPNLALLDVSHNKIKEIDPEAFSDTFYGDHLAVLILKQNFLKSIDFLFYSNVNALKFLDVSHNELSQLSQSPNKYIFHENEIFINVKYIIADFNQIGSNRINEIGNHFPNLCTLSLKGNSIYPVPRPMKGFPNLVYLDLTQNGIRYLKGDEFQNLNSLSMLILSHNQIHTYEPFYFNVRRTITLLDLSHNEIVKIGSSITKQYPLEIYSLKLYDNKLDLNNFWNLINFTHSVHNVNIGKNNVKCEDLNNTDYNLLMTQKRINDIICTAHFNDTNSALILETEFIKGKIQKLINDFSLLEILFLNPYDKCCLELHIKFDPSMKMVKNSVKNPTDYEVIIIVSCMTAVFFMAIYVFVWKLFQKFCANLSLGNLLLICRSAMESNVNESNEVYNNLSEDMFVS